MEHAYIEGYAAKLLGWPTEGEGVWSINVGVAPLGSGFGVVNLPETQRHRIFIRTLKIQYVI